MALIYYDGNIRMLLQDILSSEICGVLWKPGFKVKSPWSIVKSFQKSLLEEIPRGDFEGGFFDGTSTRLSSRACSRKHFEAIIKGLCTKAAARQHDRGKHGYELFESISW